MTQSSTSYWHSADKADASVDERRAKIPLIAEQEDACRFLLHQGRPVSRFLDLGSGGGAMAQVVLGVFPEAYGVLVDFSEPMLERARHALPADRHALILADR